MTTPFDYDDNPERFRLATRVTQQHLTAARTLYEQLAQMLAGIDARCILDVGCGEGPCRRHCRCGQGRGLWGWMPLGPC